MNEETPITYLHLNARCQSQNEVSIPISDLSKLYQDLINTIIYTLHVNIDPLNTFTRNIIINIHCLAFGVLHFTLSAFHTDQ